VATHSARSAAIRGSPRMSTGSSCTARMFRSAATWATICDLPTPQAPQKCGAHAHQRMKHLAQLGRLHSEGSFSRIREEMETCRKVFR
jgi:hypothetical protein